MPVRRFFKSLQKLVTMLFLQAMVSCVVLTMLATLTVTAQETTDVTDLIFAMDESSSQLTKEFEIARDLVADIVGDIPNFGPNGNRVGLIRFSTGAREEFNLATYNDPAQAAARLKTVVKRGGLTYTYKAINLAKSSFDTLGHAGSSKVMLMITDGMPYDIVAAKTAADNFRNAGYVLVTIYVETFSYDEAVMRDISSYFIPVKSADMLPPLRNVLVTCLYKVPEAALNQCLSERIATIAQAN